MQDRSHPLHSYSIPVARAMLAAALALSLAACPAKQEEAAAGAASSATASAAAASTASAAAGPGAAGSARPGAPVAGQPLSDDGRMQIGAADRCPVCAMTVQEHAKFASALQLTDGTTYYFCGTGCMLRSWLHPEAFLGTTKDKLRRGVVREYFTGEHRDAAAVVWVAGSDVVGPMGPALVPLADEASAKTFQERHGGKGTFTLADLDDAKWEQLTGKKAVR